MREQQVPGYGRKSGHRESSAEHTKNRENNAYGVQAGTVTKMVDSFTHDAFGVKGNKTTTKQQFLVRSSSYVGKP